MIEPGTLLLATPTILDPNFYRTVVLVCDYGTDGTLGLVLNRPSEVRVDEHLPEWAHLAAPPSLVFAGGPVQPEVAIGLALAEEAPRRGWTPIAGKLGLVDLGDGPSALLSSVRVFAGYAGWSAGQLEEEIEQDGWFVLDGTTADALSEEPFDLWASVLRRQPSTLRMFADFPPDPTLN